MPILKHAQFQLIWEKLFSSLSNFLCFYTARVNRVILACPTPQQRLPLFDYLVGTRKH